MAVSDEFVEYVVEQLSGWGEVSVRRMFGGAGLYRGGIMFAVIADDVAYLKVDDSNRDDFLRAGSAPFEPYPDKIKTTIRTYYEIPADVLENPAELAQWAERSWLIARKKSKNR
jgi:DNA transformation protein